MPSATEDGFSAARAAPPSITAITRNNRSARATMATETVKKSPCLMKITRVLGVIALMDAIYPKTRLDRNRIRLCK
jgi:hypothetical protein